MQTALDIDYRPNLWGLAGPRRGRKPLRRKRGGHRQAAIDAASLRPDRRHRGGIPHRRRHDRHDRGAARGARGVGRDAGLQARRRWARGLHRRDSRQPRRRRGRAGLPDRGVQRAGRRRRLHVGPAEGLARRRGLADRAEIRQRLRRLRGRRAMAARRPIRAGTSCSSSSSAASSARDLRNDAELEQVHWATNRRIGLAGASGSSPSTTGCSWRSCDGAHARRRSAASRSSACEAAQKVADGQPGYGLLCDGRLGRDALYKAAGTGLWIGRPVEWPGSRPLTLEPEIGPDFGGLVRMAARAGGQGAVLLPPRRRRSDLGRRRKRRSCRLFHACRRNRLEFLLEVIPSKVGADRRRHHRRGDPAVLRPRRLSRLVEAGADADRRGLGERPATTIERNDPHTPRHRGPRPRRRARTSWRDSFAVAARYPLVKGFAVGPHDLRRRRRGVAGGRDDR